MEQRDYLMKQVEQLALVLKKLLSTLLPGNNPGMETTASVNQEFAENLGYDLDQLLAIDDARWIEVLQNIPQLSPANLEKLAELLLAIGEGNPTGENRGLYRKSLLIYRHLEKSEKTWSFERNAKIDKIESLCGNGKCSIMDS